MKYIFYILLIFLFYNLAGCRSNKTIQKNRDVHKIKTMKSIKTETATDSVYNDTDSDGVPDYQDIEINEPKTVWMTESYNGQGVKKSKKTKIIYKPETTPTPNKFAKGLIAYSVPDEMTVGENYSVKIRITKDSTEKKTLIVGDTKIPINDTTINTTITIESIRISSVMSASLSSNTNFNITTKSTEIQNIEEFGYTEWEWNVMPLKSGDNPLKLIIKVRIVSEDGEKSFKDIVVFEKNILTKTNISYSFKNLINKYWQWSLSTLIIPFILWLYNRKKKEKKEIEP